MNELDFLYREMCQYTRSPVLSALLARMYAALVAYTLSKEEQPATKEALLEHLRRYLQVTLEPLKYLELVISAIEEDRLSPPAESPLYLPDYHPVKLVCTDLGGNDVPLEPLNSIDARMVFGEFRHGGTATKGILERYKQTLLMKSSIHIVTNQEDRARIDADRLRLSKHILELQLREVQLRFNLVPVVEGEQ